MTRKLSVLVVALICTFLFSSLAIASEEPRAKPGVKAAAEERQPSIDHLFKQRACNPSKKGVKETFGDLGFLNKVADSCQGWCSCSVCYCEYSGSESCCDFGCGYCWGQLDGRGACGAS